MFKVKNISILEELKFQKYRSGYSKKIAIDGYDFIDFDTESLLLKKVKFIENQFEYNDINYKDLLLIVCKSLKITIEEAQKYIERYFDRLDI